MKQNERKLRCLEKTSTNNLCLKELKTIHWKTYYQDVDVDITQEVKSKLLKMLGHNKHYIENRVTKLIWPENPPEKRSDFASDGKIIYYQTSEH